MTNITALAQRMKAAAEKATPGEWWSDVVETEGEYGEGEDRFSGYHSYAVYVGSESLLDMTNSTAAVIHTEWDNDYLMAWDETAKRNAEFIAVASPDNVKTLVEALEKAQHDSAVNWEAAASLNVENQELKQRIAELEREKVAYESVAMALRDNMRESRTVTVKLPAACADDEYFNDGVFQPMRYERDVERALRAAGIQVIEGDA